MACHGFARSHLWHYHPIESGLQDFRRPFTLSHSPLPLNYARQQDRTGRLLILILIVILLGLGSWRLRVRLRLRLGRNHSALIQWQCTPALSLRERENPPLAFSTTQRGVRPTNFPNNRTCRRLFP